MSAASIHAVLLAGGKGTRFWPASRAARPKQLLPIVSERTMVQETVARLHPLVEADRVWVVTGRDHADEIRRQLPTVSPEHVVVEPVGRNTAAAIGLAARLIARAEPDATMIVLPSDHHVKDAEGLRGTFARAVAIAHRERVLVTIGIAPTRPETGYGYIERGSEIGNDAWRVARFREKPDVVTAEQFVGSGRFFWNSGMFVWRASVVLDELARHLPETDRRLADIVAVWGDADAFARGYAALADVSIDYGVLEKAANVAVVAGEFDWDDIGSWTALARHWPKDANGNVVRGRVVALDSNGNLVVTEKRVAALVGVDDLIVVETADALLVCRRDRAQDVKRVIDELERRGWRDVL
jgi:mannose-1-phosphate guanylyltransferase